MTKFTVITPPYGNGDPVNAITVTAESALDAHKKAETAWMTSHPNQFFQVNMIIAAHRGEVSTVFIPKTVLGHRYPQYHGVLPVAILG
jgi:hypothetical protein